MPTSRCERGGMVSGYQCTRTTRVRHVSIALMFICNIRRESNCERTLNSVGLCESLAKVKREKSVLSQFKRWYESRLNVIPIQITAVHQRCFKLTHYDRVGVLEVLQHMHFLRGKEKNTYLNDACSNLQNISASWLDTELRTQVARSGR